MPRGSPPAKEKSKKFRTDGSTISTTYGVSGERGAYLSHLYLICNPDMKGSCARWAGKDPGRRDRERIAGRKCRLLRKASGGVARERVAPAGFLSRKGTVHCAGANGSGQLGNGPMISSPIPREIIGLGEPMGRNIVESAPHECPRGRTHSITV